MNVSHFIAQKIAFSGSKSFTRIIIGIAVLAVALSMTVMILTTSIISGFKKEITDKIFGFWGHIHITDSNVSRNFELVPIDQSLAAFDDIRNIASLEYEIDVPPGEENSSGVGSQISTFGGVRGIYPYILMPGLLSSKSQMHGVLLKGVSRDFDWKRMEKFIITGRPVKYQSDSAAQELLLSRNIASKLDVKSGDYIILTFIRDGSQWKKRFYICGIYNTGLEEYDRRMAMTDMAILQDILGWSASQVQGMEVVLDDIRDLDVMEDYIYNQTLPPNLYSESIRDKFPGIFEWLSLQDINERVIMWLMILVAVINMVTVLLILILERTRMIGVLKAIGAGPWQIRKVFLYHAAYIIGAGMVLGNLMGLGLAMAQKKFAFIRLDETNYYLSTAPVRLEAWSVLWINAGTFTVILFFLLIPTYLVTKITPVKALRFE